MQILIPIAGFSSYFPREEFYFPKPLVNVANRPMIEVVVDGISQEFPEAKFIFVVDEELLTKFSLDGVLSQICKNEPVIVKKRAETSGGLTSCLLAIDEINPDEPIIIMNSDQIIKAPLKDMLKQAVAQGYDAAVPTVYSVHPRWSYLESDEAGTIVKAHEKTVVSREAIAGFYFFSKSADFIEAAKQTMLWQETYQDAYYISSTLNQIILAGGSIKKLPLELSQYHSFFAPDAVKNYQEFVTLSRISKSEANETNYLIPAAGMGSRFAKAGWHAPKPFIDIDGRMMIEHVIDSLVPKDKAAKVVLQKDHAKNNTESVQALRHRNVKLLFLDGLTKGTACTVLEAAELFDNDAPLLIANSDQIVNFDCQAFIEDCIARDLDGSILVFKDENRDPKWSFAKIDDVGHVSEVAEKRAISNLATVGIYFFRKGSHFIKAAMDMIIENDRVNNEFYTCPVYNYAIKRGQKIGIYEVDAKDMHGLGTPEDLTSFIAHKGYSRSRHQPR